MTITPVKTDLDPGFVARVAAGIKYAVSGVAPNGWFGPQQPMQPSAPPEVKDRAFDYPVAYNINITPRSYEPVGFPQLRDLADGYDLLRLVIETRKDQLARSPWRITPRIRGRVADPRCAEVQSFFRRPDRLHTWSQWLRMLVEDMLVIDAATLYLRRDNGGGLYSFDIIDGATIAPKIDDSGRRPETGIAFQQVLKGMPAVDYSADELIYLPRNPRSWKIYGFSPVEQVITTVNIALRRQVAQLQHFTEGNLPEALATVPETWTPEQIRQFQSNFDAYMAGDTAHRSRLYFLPGKTTAQVLRKNPITGAFDEWLARIVCFAFSVNSLRPIHLHRTTRPHLRKLRVKRRPG